MMYGVNDTEHLFFATAASKLGSGLDEQLTNFIQEHPGTQILSPERTENEPHREPPDPVLAAVAALVTSENREWTGSPTELADQVNIGLAANALTKYLISDTAGC